MVLANPDEIEKLLNILAWNSDKNFVKRIMEPGKYGELANSDGSVSTHSMAWGETDGKYQVFPTVVQGEKGALQRLEGKDAWDRAQETGGYIDFDTPEEAEWFSKNYKKVWDR